MNAGPGMAPMETPPTESKNEETKVNTFSAAGFTMDSLKTTSEYVPKGAVALTKEQFPDLLGALDADAPPQKKGKGKKGKGKVSAPKIVEEPEEDLMTSWKGRKSEFFVMKDAATTPDVPDAQNPLNLELNDAQWDFIFKFYPEYGAAPYAMLSWIYTQALEHES